MVVLCVPDLDADVDPRDRGPDARSRWVEPCGARRNGTCSRTLVRGAPVRTRRSSKGERMSDTRQERILRVGEPLRLRPGATVSLADDFDPGDTVEVNGKKQGKKLLTVSYTHLTLPT